MCTPSKCCRKKNLCYCEHCTAYRESQLTVAKNKCKTIVCSDILSIYVPTCDEIREIEEESDYDSDNYYIADTDAEDTDGASRRYKDTKEQDDGSRKYKTDDKTSTSDVGTNKRSNGDLKHLSKTDVYSQPSRSEFDITGEDSRKYSTRKLEPTDAYEIYGTPNKSKSIVDPYDVSNTSKSKYSYRKSSGQDDDYLYNTDKISKNGTNSDLREYEKKKEECRKFCEEEAARKETSRNHLNYNSRKRYKKDTDSEYSCDLDDDMHQGASRGNQDTCRCRHCYDRYKQMGTSRVKSKTSSIWNKISTTFFKDDSCKKWCAKDKCVCGKLHTINESPREYSKRNSKNYVEEDTDEDTDVESSNSKYVPKKNVPQRAVQSLKDTPQVCQCCGCHQGTGYSAFRSMVFPYKSMQVKRMKFCDMLRKFAGRNDKSEINLCQKCCEDQYRKYYK